MDFKYKTKFDITAQIKKVPKLEISQASLDELRDKVIPKDLKLDINKDLLPIAFNAFVANSFNLNDDGVSGKTAKKMAASFINKPINIEHDRESIVGFITNHSFTSIKDNAVLSNKEVDKLIASNEEFNVALGGVIWRVANDSLADFLVESDEEKSDTFMSVSASWELGFGEARIALIEGNSRKFSDATFIEDPDEMEKIGANLRSSGGNGKFDDKNVFREVIGEPLPLGIGLTESPAAKVKGIATHHDLTTKKNRANIELSEEVIEQIGKAVRESINKIIVESVVEKKGGALNMEQILSMAKETSIEKINQEKQEKTEKLQIKSSQKNKLNVKNDNKKNSLNKTMDKLKSLNELSVGWFETYASSPSDMYTTIVDHIKERSKKYEDMLEQRDSAAKTIEEAKKQSEEALEETKAQMDKLQQQFDELTADKLAREKQDAFDTRMASFEDKYDLSDEQRKAIANSIKDLCDEDYQKAKESLTVFLQDKEKSNIQAKKDEEKKVEEELKAKEAKASKKQGVESILDEAFKNGKLEDKTVGATTSTEEDKYADLRQEFTAEKLIV